MTSAPREPRQEGENPAVDESQTGTTQSRSRESRCEASWTSPPVLTGGSEAGGTGAVAASVSV
ncbi:MAG: hypothetical protein QG597_4967 [Actinomycetota bacterium]|nr:hypothetical protein [Actinomycetota bacterium]